MIKHSEKVLAVLGVIGVVILSNDAKAMTQGECEQLSGNMYLAAIERGECEIDDIQTAAGPQQPDEFSDEGGGGNRNRDGRNGGEGGGGGGEGGNGGGSRDGGRGAAGKP
jgi:hypothetical protein